MKDLRINTPFMKIQYWISWVAFIVFGFIIAWIIAIFLYNYGKDTIENKKKEKGLLNMSYQKFIFWWGAIWGDLFIIALIIDIILFPFRGYLA